MMALGKTVDDSVRTLSIMNAGNTINVSDALNGQVLTLTPVAQCSKDISARKAKNPPKSLTNSITFGAADGATDRPAGQTCSKTATAFAGKTAISTPAMITKAESAFNAGVGELESALTGSAVWLTARPVTTR
jgi:hypothetical protein